MMLHQEEIKFFLAKFNDERPSLVIEALDECINLHIRSGWDTLSRDEQINSIWCWISGWKKRDEALFIIPDEGFSGKWEAGF